MLSFSSPLANKGSETPFEEIRGLRIFELRAISSHALVNNMPPTLALGDTSCGSLPSSLIDGARVIWRKPGTWWLISMPTVEHAGDLVVIESLNGEFALHNVSHQFCCLRLPAESARKALVRGAVIDLDERSFPAGAATQIRLASVSVLIEVSNDGTWMYLYVDRSVGWHLAEWLMDAHATTTADQKSEA